MTSSPRWFTDTDDDHSDQYVAYIRELAAQNADLAGEARFMDALIAPGSRVLDAGCGPGRVGAALHERGHQVVGVDVDPILIAAAVQDYPGPRWVVSDLVDMDLMSHGVTEPFDAAVLAGNVLAFVEAGHAVCARAMLVGFEQAVRDAVSQWEPRIDLEDVAAVPDEEDVGLVRIEIAYRLRATVTDGYSAASATATSNNQVIYRCWTRNTNRR